MIIITGHEGYIGKNLTDRLRRDNTSFRGIEIEDWAEFIENEESIGPHDTLIHLAGMVPRRATQLKPDIYRTANLKTTTQLLDKLTGIGFQGQVIQLSTSMSYIKELSEVGRMEFSTPEFWTHTLPPYPRMKLAEELAFQTAAESGEFNVATLRITNVYGSEHDRGSLPYLLKCHFREIRESGQTPKELKAKDTTVRRDFIHVSDVVRCIQAAASWLTCVHDVNYSAFTVGKGLSHSIDDLFKASGFTPLNRVDPSIRPRSVDVDVAATCEKLNWTAQIDIREWTRNNGK